ncbi:dienelactone hydrolase family protein [Brevibacterium album]|uniref:dienelactone hydrolase family protein n=1 Tax=Brevibacterium album TaxID=417948 RepID=UPI000416CD66|nr:dienelactone hydrolase family protein [Brevibacterium album]
MAHVIFFHSALGLDKGVHAMADVVREAGHTVTTPDVYDGNVFECTGAGIAYRDEVGFRTLADRAAAALSGVEGPFVAAGVSLGAALAQRLGKKDPRTEAAILLHAGGESRIVDWPASAALQIHHSVDDPWIDEGGPENLLRSAARAGARAEHYLYPGSAHLFADPTKPEFDERSADLLSERVQLLLEDLDAARG